MDTDLMPWIIVWTVVTAGVIAVALFRWTLGLHDIVSVKFGPQQAAFFEKQDKMGRQLKKVDFYGITLTLISITLALVIAALWLYQAIKAT